MSREMICSECENLVTISYSSSNKCSLCQTDEHLMELDEYDDLIKSGHNFQESGDEYINGKG
jgi:LSD1 subclass zinc finger protein